MATNETRIQAAEFGPSHLNFLITMAPLGSCLFVFIRGSAPCLNGRPRD